MSTILAFLVVLGILVFVHEMGHFLAAKACNIYVDRFSLGMPPRLFGFKYGETDYCIGLLPIGGYVKMAGQEDAPLSEEEREETYGHVPPERFFNNKKIWQRAIVLLAGPLMNLVLAYFLFGFMAAYGREVRMSEFDTRVGMILEDAPVADAPLYEWKTGNRSDTTGPPAAIGWRTGDKIVSINGKEAERFEDIAVAAILGKNEEALVELKRPLPDGTSKRYLSLVTPQILDEELNAAQFGLAPFAMALIQQVRPDMTAAQFGLQVDDVVVMANDVYVDRNTFSKMVRELPPGTDLRLVIQRGEEKLDLTMTTQERGAFKEIAFAPSLGVEVLISDDESPEVPKSSLALLKEKGIGAGDRIKQIGGDTKIGSTLRALLKNAPNTPVEITIEQPSRREEGVFGVASVTPYELLEILTAGDVTKKPEVLAIEDDLSESSGLQPQDVIIEIDGEAATVALLTRIQNERIGESIKLRVHRPSIGFGILQKAKDFDAELTVSSIQQIGVIWGEKMIIRREKPADVVPAAFKEGNKQATRIKTILTKLFTGELSPKLLGGPVMIAHATSIAFSDSVMRVIELTAIISINLCIFNLLPLPVLDGGQLMFLGIEAIRRRPVSIKFMEAVQQAGFLLIIGLLLFVTWNDVSRIISGFLP